MLNRKKHTYLGYLKCFNINDKPFLLPISYFAFTLAEVLITLGIIGIVAAIAIPIVQNSASDNEFKIAYKKAYSDLSQAFTQAINDNSLTARPGQFDTTATASEWAAIQNAFKVEQSCTPAQLNSCWVDGDKVYQNTHPSTASSSSFVDGSGRSWAEYSSLENLYLVDTNGFKQPNKFGKDRWIFTFRDSNNVRVATGLPYKVGIFTGDNTVIGDYPAADSDWCQYPPCYYYSWLYKN